MNRSSFTLNEKQKLAIKEVTLLIISMICMYGAMAGFAFAVTYNLHPAVYDISGVALVAGYFLMKKSNELE